MNKQNAQGSASTFVTLLEHGQAGLLDVISRCCLHWESRKFARASPPLVD
jgi:hypothetical protein